MASPARPTLAIAPNQVPAAQEPAPLAVWPCAQTSAQFQRTGRYVPASSRHPGKMLPELARRLVAEYCPPKGLVVDPMCGIGTTLVEAAALGCRAVGVELEPRWAELARSNLTHALPADRAALAEVRVGDARQLRELLADLSGRVDLMVASPPYAAGPASARRRGGRRAWHRDHLTWQSPSTAIRQVTGGRTDARFPLATPSPAEGTARLCGPGTRCRGRPGGDPASAHPLGVIAGRGASRAHSSSVSSNRRLTAGFYPSTST
jgi:hypothetical protein